MEKTQFTPDFYADFRPIHSHPWASRIQALSKIYDSKVKANNVISRTFMSCK